MKYRTNAAVLSLLFGWTGAHQFYMGNALQGMLYIAATLLASGSYSAYWATERLERLRAAVDDYSYTGGQSAYLTFAAILSVAIFFACIADALLISFMRQKAFDTRYNRIPLAVLAIEAKLNEMSDRLGQD